MKIMLRGLLKYASQISKRQSLACLSTQTQAQTNSGHFVEKNDNYVTLHLNTWRKPLKLSYMWLRDNCRCSECYNEKTLQRKRELQPNTSRGLEAIDHPAQDCYADKEFLQVFWPCGHESRYDYAWLAQLAAVGPRVQPILWRQGSELERRLEGVPSSEFLQNDTARDSVLLSLAKYGVGLVTGVGVRLRDTQEIAERICPIMHTNFGDMWETRADLQHQDSAYTNEKVPPHNDNTYWREPAGVIAFHVTRPAIEDGGASLLVDGFAALASIWSTNRPAFDLLSQVWHGSEYLEEGKQNCSSRAPVVTIDPAAIRATPENIVNALIQIRFNPLDRSPLPPVMEPEEIDAYYAAYRLLSHKLNNNESAWRKLLKPGQVLLIDNWRVLHAREGFEGDRVLTGCYLRRPDVQTAMRLRGIL